MFTDWAFVLGDSGICPSQRKTEANMTGQGVLILLSSGAGIALI